MASAQPIVLKLLREVISKSELESLHTKQLLNLYKDWNYRNSWNFVVYDGLDYDRSQLENLHENCKNIKEILATRPHIPNKLESKQKRQLAAKRGR